MLLIPDQYLARYVAIADEGRDHLLEGRCEVHERFTGEELRGYREAEPGIKILAHPECPPDVIAEADYTGSTAA